MPPVPSGPPEISPVLEFVEREKIIPSGPPEIMPVLEFVEREKMFLEELWQRFADAPCTERHFYLDCMREEVEVSCQRRLGTMTDADLILEINARAVVREAHERTLLTTEDSVSWYVLPHAPSYPPELQVLHESTSVESSDESIAFLRSLRSRNSTV